MTDKARRLVDIPSLDGLRAVSIAIVFFAHAGFPGVPGDFGVSIFFVISGFLITTLLRIELDRSGGVSLRNFYLRRAFRILPLFYCVLLIGVILMQFGLGDGLLTRTAVISQFAHYFNFFAITHSGYNITPGTGVYWSLAIEEHFYVFFPLLLVLLTRLRLTHVQKGAVLLAGCGVVLAWRLVLVYGWHVPQVRTYYGTDTRMDGLLFGCAAALIASPVLDRTPTSRRPDWKIAAIAVGAMLLTFVVRNEGLRETLRYTVQSVAIVVAMRYLILAVGTVPFRALNWRPIAWFGRMSFAFYLVHQTVISEVQKHVSSKVAVLVIALALSTLVAWGLHLLVERPAARLRSRLTRSPARPPRIAPMPVPSPSPLPAPLPPPSLVAAD